MKVGIAGATGAVGQEIINVLAQKKFPLTSLTLFSSARSAGKKLKTPLGEYILQEFSLLASDDLDLIFLAVGGSFSKQYASALCEKGIVVIDNSSAFRYDDSVPLIIAPINGECIEDSKLIANPNCTTAILGMALYPLYKIFGLKKVIVSTYQATSGAGQPGMDELTEQSKNFLDGNPVENNIFTHPIPFNIIPHIDAVQSNEYTKEEMKVVWETHKIFGDDSFPVSCTSVRIPTFRAHAESVVIETKHPIDVAQARNILSSAVGVDMRDNIHENIYPMPKTASRKYNVEVGRIRKNLVFGEYGLEFFVCGDQLLRGAALNAVEIAELIAQK